MNDRLAGKVALVTGGASGLGAETARLFVEAGARVAITDLADDAGKQLAAELGADRALFLHHDVASEADWQRVIADTATRLGALDVLVNNAGILIPGDIEHATLDAFRKTIEVNAQSCFLGLKHGVAAMKARGGAIVSVASVASWLAVDGYPAYSASKAAVAALTRSAALHCRRKGYDIRINSLHPDGIWTPMMQASLPPGVPPEAVLFDPHANPRGRALKVEHVARALLFLASEDAATVSGAELHADRAVHGLGL
ncbi:MAG TPA: SDR family oxidoreductase [Rhodanobacter sp.]|nr:SDR family oxidoreductase [Rhodanobacter sp.]